MAGTLPATYLLVTHYGGEVGTFTSYFDVALHFGISIDVGTGIVTFNNHPQNPSYVLGTDANSFTPEEALRDWSKEYLKSNLPSSYKIHRCLY